MSEKINIYTDGSCLNNPGKGGWGIVIIKPNSEIEEYSKGYQLTTNSRMEMYAILMALKYVEKHHISDVDIHSDSNFIVQAFNNHWLENWVKKGWKKTKNEPVANSDIWKIIYPLYKKLNVNFIKVKAHSGIEYNERVDELAKAAAMGDDLNFDKGYLAENQKGNSSINFISESNNIILENVLYNGTPSIKLKDNKNIITISRKQLEDFLNEK